MKEEWVVATRNAHKVIELRELLGDIITLVTLDDVGVPNLPEEEEIERFETFAENALTKAAFYAAICGRTVLAEDSGLVVDALDGAPGVHSKRFSGRTDLTGDALDRENLRIILERAAEVPDWARAARYECWIAVAGAEPMAIVHGEVRGHLAKAPSGNAGFGYDPIFAPEGEVKTFGELGQAVKNRRSHRAEAVKALRLWLDSA